ncbi:MAG: glycosyltransferase family 4 protein [Nanoarchaeota archaeon]
MYQKNQEAYIHEVKGKKVLYLPEFDLENDMVGRWRHQWPSKHLKEYGIDYKIHGAMEPIIYRPTKEELESDPNRHAVEIRQDMGFNSTDNTAQAHMLKKMKPLIDEADIVVFGRTNNLYCADIFKYAKEKGKVVGYEVDDLTFGKKGAFRKTNKPGDKSLNEYIGEHVKGADFVTVSTPYLKKEAAKLRGTDENIYIVKNRLDLDSLEDAMPEIKKPKEGEVRIGWAGGKYHIDKLIKMKDVFIKLHRKHGDKLRFVFKGFDDSNMVTEREKSKLREFKGIFEQNGIKYELNPYTKAGDWKDYYRELGNLKLDIFFAPMKSNAPHEAKSELKYLEAAYVGAPIVVPAIGGHKDAVTHNENGMLISPADQNRGFYKSIDDLISDPEKRYKIAKRARKDIKENYDVKKSSEELVRIFTEQLRRRKTSNHG